MALSNNLSSIRGIHVSPGIYTKETVLEYAVRSLGITTLGAVGETVKGPAFQPMHIEDWNQFKSVFGGTDPSKFKGSQYPKYELPYIAKSYLSESKQMEVVRVLGLGGYNAGPAWVITASDSSNPNSKTPIAILRSRGEYKKYPLMNDADCNCQLSSYDTLKYYVGEKDTSASTGSCPKRAWDPNAVWLETYTTIDGTVDCNENVNTGSTETTGDSFPSSSTNYGKFTIKISGQTDASYSVSLNPYDKDYILKVLGNTPDDSSALLFVESLFDVALINGVDGGKFNQIDKQLQAYMPTDINEIVEISPVNALIDTDNDEKAASLLKRANKYKRFLAEYDVRFSSGVGNVVIEETVTETGSTTALTGDLKCGVVYSVIDKISSTGKKEYFFHTTISGDNVFYDSIKNGGAVQNIEDNRYYRMDGSSVVAVTLDLNDYKSAYRYASTPWIVSNLLGDKNNVHVERLFRLHTISDGNNSNMEVKASIENIRPDDGTFDLLIHDINDTDEYPVVLERYTKCSMKPGPNFIGYKVGSYDGTYEVKSKYVTVEVNESLVAQTSVPSGFLGYPTINFKGCSFTNCYSGSGVTNVPIAYNKTYDPDVKNKKQYFGLSTRAGVDIDMFTFKGNAVYYDEPASKTNGFHLDSRLATIGESATTGTTVVELNVSGIPGWKFEFVPMNAATKTLNKIPIIDSEANMEGCIYENVNLRKFMVYFAGGFDGWDVYRDQRTNTDDFKANKYLGSINNNTGKGYNFDQIANPETIGLNENGITSDYYAYLAGARQFANPESVDCNIMVTPGIDLINNKELSQEIIEMIETERADSLYVATLPDKPMGAGDYIDEMYTADDVVGLLEDTDIDSNYTCTFYPWVKYFDQDNSQYIYLPATKDVVRNMAMTDNESFPWFAPAGFNRGNVDCVRAHVVTKIADEDTLYDGRINPIKTFAQDGVKIWGQKTLQVADNQLNRIATRRLMLRMRKLLSIGLRELIFEPNDPTVKQQFMSIVTPIMDNLRANRGITDYRIQVLDTVETRQRYELPARIFFKAPSQLEYILLDLVLTPEGIQFDNI